MPGTTHLVSIIMNCWNGEKYLREAIDSVYAQTYQNWEIIFWDNCSIDNSASIAQSYDERLKYFLAEGRTHLGEARLLAVNQGKGEYFSFLDCDDIWEPHKTEKQVKLLQKDNGSSGFVYSRCKVISENGETLGYIPHEKNYLQAGDIFGDLSKKNFIPFVSVLIPRNKYYEVGGFPQNYKNSTDYYLFLKLSYKYKILAINDVLCKYREHSENLSHSQYVIGAEESVKAVSSFLPDSRADIGLKYQYAHLGIMYVKERKIVTALVLLMKKGGIFILMRRIIRKLFSLR